MRLWKRIVGSYNPYQSFSDWYDGKFKCPFCYNSTKLTNFNDCATRRFIGSKLVEITIGCESCGFNKVVWSELHKGQRISRIKFNTSSSTFALANNIYMLFLLFSFCAGVSYLIYDDSGLSFYVRATLGIPTMIMCIYNFKVIGTLFNSRATRILTHVEDRGDYFYVKKN